MAHAYLIDKKQPLLLFKFKETMNTNTIVTPGCAKNLHEIKLNCALLRQAKLNKSQCGGPNEGHTKASSLKLLDQNSESIKNASHTSDLLKLMRMLASANANAV